MTITIIAFDRHPLHGIKQGGAERARNDAGLTPDALVRGQSPLSGARFLMACLGGAHLYTEGFLTVLTSGRR